MEEVEQSKEGSGYKLQLKSQSMDSIGGVSGLNRSGQGPTCIGRNFRPRQC